MQPNQLSIPEPVNTHFTINPEKLDLVILPLIAFDKLGNRLGTGGGYYDRTFSFMHGRENKIPYMMGLGFAMQETDAIQAEPWDIKIDAVLTEKELLTF